MRIHVLTGDVMRVALTLNEIARDTDRSIRLAFAPRALFSWRGVRHLAQEAMRSGDPGILSHATEKLRERERVRWILGTPDRPDSPGSLELAGALDLTSHLTPEHSPSMWPRIVKSMFFVAPVLLPGPWLGSRAA